MQTVFALIVTVVSSCLLNLGYLVEHGAASRLPPLTLRRPLASARLLLRSGRWLGGFAVEAAGWGLYVLALSLAPLSLVQAAAAGGIGILAIMVSRATGVPLRRGERVGAAVSVVGLALLGASLVGDHASSTAPDLRWVAGWLLASAGLVALALRALPGLVGAGPPWGIAAGILFAAGDISTKVAVDDRNRRIVFVVCLVVAYGLGTLALQAAFQRSGALTAAGLATLLANALPIAAGMTVFHELSLSGWSGAVRLAAFVAVVAGAVMLAARTKAVTSAAAAEGEPDLRHGFA